MLGCSLGLPSLLVIPCWLGSCHAQRLSDAPGGKWSGPSSLAREPRCAPHKLPTLNRELPTVPHPPPMRRGTRERRSSPGQCGSPGVIGLWHNRTSGPAHGARQASFNLLRCFGKNQQLGGLSEQKHHIRRYRHCRQRSVDHVRWSRFQDGDGGNILFADVTQIAEHL